MIETVQVTGGHIEAGEPGYACRCPVALALMAAGVEIAAVDQHSIFVSVPDGLLEMDTPPEVVEFICRFERGQSVDPFTFQLPQGRVVDLPRRGTGTQVR